MGTPINESDWGKSCEYVLGISSNVLIRESFLKVRTRWYYVPTKVYKMFPTSNPICWQCPKEHGNMLHMWWSCFLLRAYWKAIHIEIMLILGISIPFTPECFPLHIIALENKVLLTLLNNLLVAAMILVAKNWKSQNVAKLHEWRLRCYHSLLMSKITAIKNIMNEKG